MSAGRILTTIALLAAIGATAACGRKGDLETPYSAAVEARKKAERNDQPLPPEPTPPVKDRKFFLDRLI